MWGLEFRLLRLRVGTYWVYPQSSDPNREMWHPVLSFVVLRSGRQNLNLPTDHAYHTVSYRFQRFSLRIIPVVEGFSAFRVSGLRVVICVSDVLLK